jgi:hypothetical protein
VPNNHRSIIFNNWVVKVGHLLVKVGQSIVKVGQSIVKVGQSIVKVGHITFTKPRQTRYTELFFTL